MARSLAFLLMLSLICATFSSRAVEVLIFENFDSFDLAKPGSWSVSVTADLSIVDEAGHGKVLRIDGKGNGWPHLSLPLDIAKLRGHQIRIAASGKFPGAYNAIAGKDWARPKLQLIIKDKNGKDSYAAADLQPGKLEWQDLQAVTTVDKEADSVNLFLRVDLVAAEVFFDDLSIEIDPDLKSAPPKAKPATPVAVPTPAPTPNPANPTPAPTPAPAGSDAIAKKAPRKTIDDGGVIFSPDIAAALQKLSPGANKSTFALLGPGLPIKELETKLPEKWTRVAASEKTIGASATPRNLLAALPDFIAKNKPEVIFLFGETAVGARKTNSSEHYDWEDIARLCTRMGVVPVLAVPPAAPGTANPAEAREDLRTSMLGASGDAACVAIDLKVPSQIPRRVTLVTDLLDKFVFLRTSPDAPEAGTGTKKPAEE